MFGLFWWKANSKPVSSDENKTIFVVRKGKSAAEIAQSLADRGFIKKALAFKIYVQLTGRQENINAGEFVLSPSMSLKEIIKTLQGGPLELWATIPEGLRREEIAGVLIESLNVADENKSQFKEDFLNLTANKEGYLFPDTYLFPPDTDAQAVVNKLLSTFEDKTKDLHDHESRDFEDVVIMASIIERETKTDDERPIVAGILWKRLNDGWPLQADATLQYAVAGVRCKNISDCDWWQVPTINDREIDSLYNTYKYSTLPPTPISNPGISSLDAATNPTLSDYWYYIHDSAGQIHYAKTLDEHNVNIAKYLKN